MRTAMMIKKAEEKLVKLEATYKKHMAKAEKLEDGFWAEIAREDAARKAKEIEATKARIETLKEKLAKEQNRRNIPEIFIPFRDSLVASWDEYDKAQRDKVIANGPGETYKETILYSDMRNLTDEQIHEKNEDDAYLLIERLINRVEKKGGAVKGYSNLYIHNGNWMEGGIAINGYVDCEKRSVDVQSILAGGYNIQRLHVRVLVK